MEVNDDPSTQDQGDPLDAPADLPPGDHPLEIAARHGIGPLSPLARDAWHGQARPCVSCGQLVRRDQPVCDHCDQDLGPEMLAKMRAHAGPWYVLEHVRPFPGVNLERIIRQIKRGVLTETSILRGPETNFQWRFAAETPGLCRFFGRCWNCHRSVSQDNTHCPACRASLVFHRQQNFGTHQRQNAGAATEPAPPEPAPPTAHKTRPAMPTTIPASVRTKAPALPRTTAQKPSTELEALRSVIENNPAAPRNVQVDIPQTRSIIGALWLPVVMLLAVVLGLAWLSSGRTNSEASSAAPPVQNITLERPDSPPPSEP